MDLVKGIPNTIAERGGQVVWFDVCGLPCTIWELRDTLRLLRLRVAEMEETGRFDLYLPMLHTNIAEREALIERMEAYSAIYA